jgi:uncharacterized membrane protein YfcA
MNLLYLAAASTDPDTGTMDMGKVVLLLVGVALTWYFGGKLLKWFSEHPIITIVVLAAVVAVLALMNRNAPS